MSASFLAAAAQRGLDLNDAQQSVSSNFEMLPNDVLLTMVPELVRNYFQHRAQERLELYQQWEYDICFDTIFHLRFEVCATGQGYTMKPYRPFRWLSQISQRMRTVIDLYLAEILQRVGALESAIVIQQHARSFIDPERWLTP